MQLCIVHLIRNCLNYVSWKDSEFDLLPHYDAFTVARPHFSCLVVGEAHGAFTAKILKFSAQDQQVTETAFWCCVRAA